jgi:hypothetical protein
VSAYRGAHLRDFLARHPVGPGDTTRAPSEILTIVSLGRVPIKHAERIPIGAAIGIAGSEISGDLDVLGYSVTKVLVYPELGTPTSEYSGAVVQVDGRGSALEQIGDFGAEITEEYDRARPRILAAAVSRMVARAAAAEGAREAGKRAGDGDAVLGWLAALITESTLVALDKPDTRSWTLLPERVLVSRAPVAPGSHRVRVDLHGYGAADGRDFEVEVADGGFTAVVVTPLR